MQMEIVNEKAFFCAFRESLFFASSGIQKLIYFECVRSAPMAKEPIFDQD